MAVFVLKPCDMIKASKNTFKYTVFSTDFGVYLCISLKLSPCLSNLKKSSIFPLIGLKFFQLSSFFLIIPVLNFQKIIFLFQFSLIS